MSQQASTFNPNESQMTLMEHLLELRTRLIWVCSALVIGTVLALFFYTPLVTFITSTARDMGVRLQILNPLDSIGIIFRVSFTAGTALALPVIIYHVIAFMAPGLYPNERRNILLTLPAILILFGIGAAFAFFVLLPVAVGFLSTILTGVFEQDWAADRYLNFVTRLVFWIGVSFEMPLVVAIIARMGLVSGPTLLRVWRQAFVVIAIVAAAITPTVDPVNMAIVMIPLIALYFGSVGLAYLLYRPREVRDFSEEPFIKE
ncbi:MAG: twin-arginine translocase subunit TatC [Caldilineaceae bacterium]|nr:twin-arginine translocase subunit TatC [Caldilineaceae bacterium]